MRSSILWTQEATQLVCQLIDLNKLTDETYDEFVNRCEGHARYDGSYFVCSDDVRLVASYMIDQKGGDS